MKCPRCGLVHPPGEQVCRRCEIDLRTAEPRPRVTAPQDRPRPPSVLERLRAKAPGRVRLKKKTAAPVKVHPEKAPAPAAAGRMKQGASFVSLALRKKTGLSRVFRGLRPRGKLKKITCVQCSAPMAINRDAPFPRSAPAALIIMGAALLVAGIFFHLLLITGVIAAVLGIIYLRVGNTYWKCSACGFTIPRARG